MFPGRFWLALGSGENMNEHITGDPWPLKETRQQRLEECVDVIRRLHSGEEVTHHGLVTVEQARIWDVPEPRRRSLRRPSAWRRRAAPRPGRTGWSP